MKQDYRETPRQACTSLDELVIVFPNIQGGSPVSQCLIHQDTFGSPLLDPQ